VPGATSYNWSVPPGSSVAFGQGTDNVIVDFGPNPGLIQVSAINSCGQSGQTNFPVSLINCRMETQNRDELNEMLSASIAVFPNPSSDKFEFYVSNLLIEQAIINIYDVLGQTVLHRIVNNNHFEIQGNVLKPGIYWYELTKYDNILFRGKLVKE